MRKLLLGSTAVAAAALFAPNGANAQSLSGDAFSATQGAPAASLRGLEVRIGGFYKAMYAYIDQDGANSPTGRLGSSDFTQEIEFHILASGKAANGLRYGVALEVQNDATRTGTDRNSLDYDEAWAFLAGSWGQVRFGDEDGAISLLQSGHITGFGVGGLDSGDVNQETVGTRNRGQWNTPNDLGDNTKLIYLSPQFAGFDAGVSFAFNQGGGPNDGCPNNATGPDSIASSCDRLAAIVGGSTRRRNEVQAALRWRGSFGPVGAAATVGYIGADAIKNIGGAAERLDMIWAGATATAYGFTFGGWYTGGNANGNFATLTPSRPNNAIRDDKGINAYLVGATYTIDAITVGGHFAQSWSAGDQFNPNTLRQTGWSVGGNYRVAPGLDFFAEYNNMERKETGFTFNRPGDGKTQVDLVLAGFRVAF
ncbi:porin [Roseomonas xinghualingensis]|uniref:porin n=1 Tax=Roseomonas xinghualingensis TaxID=2986475 RepID=UPI0021F238C5|nr:porin [Roseomonas sp. SXEYE001]MCV4206040.1 porin [Roseomonas sp. SXEYE001]